MDARILSPDVLPAPAGSPLEPAPCAK